MKIAVDFDNTISADPRLFAIFIQAAVSLGHEVAIVTSRHPTCPIPLTFSGVPIVYCGFTAKRKHFQADIWIDDDPLHIDKDHDMSVFK